MAPVAYVAAVAAAAAVAASAVVAAAAVLAAAAAVTAVAPAVKCVALKVNMLKIHNVNNYNKYAMSK